MTETILAWINRAVIFGTVIMYGALGETLTEKSGNMNLGTPGVMCIGGAAGFCGVYLYEIHTENPSAFLCILIGLLFAFISSALAGTLYCVLTTTLRANQNVTGLALTIFGSGFAKFIGSYVIPAGTTSVKAIFSNGVFSKRILSLPKLGVFSSIFLNYGFMMYVAIIIAILMSVFLKKSHVGLNLRAVGENPATADAAGISVTKYKYVSTIIGSGIAGLGGVYYILDYNYGGWSTFAAQSIEALGWLAVALVIFAAWRPHNLIWGSYLFGICYWAFNYINVFGIKMNTAVMSLLEMIPYVVTIIVLIISSLRNKRENQPPAHLGMPYFREDR
ncbi:MAG: ABC transporter permease [Clostridia bacterium]|nr:ABC transporter permease [Clostridia bacterium]